MVLRVSGEGLLSSEHCRRPTALLCTKATLVSLADLKKSQAVLFAKTWDTLHALVSALLEGADVPIMRYFPDIMLSLKASCTWPVQPLDVQYFGSSVNPMMQLCNDEEKASYKTGLLLKAAGLLTTQRRDLCHRINLNLIESWRNANLMPFVIKLNSLLKSCQGPFGSQGNKQSKSEMYQHILECFSFGAPVFGDRIDEFAFDWGVKPSSLTNEMIYDRFTEIGLRHLTDGSDVKNTKWMSLIWQFPEFEEGWTSDLIAFEHYYMLTGKIDKKQAEDKEELSSSIVCLVCK